MKQSYLLTSLLALGAFAFANASQAQQGEPQRQYANACEALRSAQNAAKFARIPDAPTSINSADLIKADGDGSIIEQGLPEICRIDGTVAPTVGFLLRMPTTTWNGKFMMGGCGGPCGNFLTDRIDAALARNYAVVVTDMGHRGNGMLYALDNIQGRIDWAYRSTHVTAVVSKVIIEAYYGEQPKYSYFWGCSTGGRQALTEAQRFPKDFDGIVGGAPPWITNTGQPTFTSLWRAHANMDADGKPIMSARGKVKMLHEAVLKACDANDGLKDGLILDPPSCKFDPRDIVCKAGQDPAQCLTSAEAGVVQKYYDGPRESNGRQLFKGYSRGSEHTWTFPQAISKAPGAYGALSYVSFYYPPFPEYDPSKFNWDNDPERFKLIDPIYEHRNPDLREFKAVGGKLILFNGYDDGCCLADVAIDYYETSTKTMGGEDATREFFRFFAMPHQGHCRYGKGGGEVDWITAIENWVEKGIAPDAVTAYKMRQEPYPSVQRSIHDPAETLVRMARHPLPEGSYEFARPVYAWPDKVRYKGKGDPKLVDSWEKAPRKKSAR